MLNPRHGHRPEDTVLVTVLASPTWKGAGLNCGDLIDARRPVRVRVAGVDLCLLDRDGDGDGRPPRPPRPGHRP